MMPLSPSVDVPGIFARSARDVARLLGIVAGRDARDPRSSGLPVPDYEASVERGVAGLRIGVPQNFFLEGVAGDVALRLEESLQALAALGAEIVPVTVPAPEHLTELSRVLVYSEAAAIHGPWLREHAEHYSPQVRMRAATGLAIPAAAYQQAQQLRSGILRRFVDAVFAKCDVLHLPTLGIPVPTLAETDVGGSAAMWEKIAVLVRCTAPFNYLGLPALSVPCGFTDNGLPTSFQLVGRPFAEATLLRSPTPSRASRDWTPGAVVPSVRRATAQRAPARPAIRSAASARSSRSSSSRHRRSRPRGRTRGTGRCRGSAADALQRDDAIARRTARARTRAASTGRFRVRRGSIGSVVAMIASDPEHQVRLTTGSALHSMRREVRAGLAGLAAWRCAARNGSRMRGGIRVSAASGYSKCRSGVRRCAPRAGVRRAPR